MNIKPAPGVILIKQDKETPVGIVTSQQSKTRILKGRVIALGPILITDQGAKINPEAYVDIGQVVWFLSYEGSYDVFDYESERYYCVKVQDIRATL